MAETKLKPIQAFGSVPRCRVFKTANQSISNNTSTLVTWDNEAFDNDSMHDNSTNNERITINTAGVYLVNAQISFASNSTGRREVRLGKNGNEYATGMGAWYSIANTGGDRTTFSTMAIVEASATDYFTVHVYQNSTASLNIEGGDDANYRCHFEVIYLGKV